MSNGSVKDVKRRIKSVKSTEQITSAMKLVSASKLRRARLAYEKASKHFYFVTESIEEIFANSSELESMFLMGSRDILSTCYVVITSNQGLCGGFNSNVIKEVDSLIKNDPEKPVLVTIGQKGKDYYSKKSEYHIAAEYIAPPERISFLDTHKISKPIIDLYRSKQVDEIIMVHNTFGGALEQHVNTVHLLPMDLTERKTELKPEREVDYEPSINAVFNYLIEKYVEVMIYSAILESAASEHAARHVAMDNATKNANEMIDELTLSYNRIRQGAITQEITEIVGGAEALK